MNKNFLKYFCHLCWRPIDPSDERSKFCAIHRQPHGSTEYKQRRRLLDNVAKQKGKYIPINEVFNSLLSEVTSADSVNREITKSSENRAESITISEISNVCAAYYKKCFSKLKLIDVTRFKSAVDWGAAIVKAMTKTKPFEITTAWEDICALCTPAEQRRLLIHLLSRIETEKQELATPLSRGPIIGSVDINNEIMRSLLIAYDELMNDKISVNLSTIAKEHGVTRQTVYAKWKMLLRSPEMYRKVINDVKIKNG